MRFLAILARQKSDCDGQGERLLYPNALRSVYLLLRSSRFWGLVALIVCGDVLFQYCTLYRPSVLLRDVLGNLYQLRGHEVEVFGRCLSLPWTTVRVTDKCTYIDLMLYLFPLCLVLRWRFHWRILLCGVTIVVVSVLNLARIVAVLEGLRYGYPWYWLHDVPDLILWYGTFGAAFVVWQWQELRWVRSRRTAAELKQARKNPQERS